MHLFSRRVVWFHMVPVVKSFNPFVIVSNNMFCCLIRNTELFVFCTERFYLRVLHQQLLVQTSESNAMTDYKLMIE